VVRIFVAAIMAAAPMVSALAADVQTERGKYLVQLVRHR